MTHIVIPANANLGHVYDDLFAWLRANAVEPFEISADHPVTITEFEIRATTQYGSIVAPIRTKMPVELVRQAVAAGWVEGTGVVAELDPIGHLVNQLAEARAAKKAAAEREEEARDEILRILAEKRAEFGTVGGRPAVRRNVVEKSQFQTVKFRNANPELAAEYTTKRTETRLELL